MKPGGRERKGELTLTLCQTFSLNNYTHSHWLGICYVLGTFTNFYPLTLTDTNEADHISPIYSFFKNEGSKRLITNLAKIAHCCPLSVFLFSLSEKKPPHMSWASGCPELRLHFPAPPTPYRYVCTWLNSNQWNINRIGVFSCWKMFLNDSRQVSLLHCLGCQMWWLELDQALWAMRWKSSIEDGRATR